MQRASFTADEARLAHPKLIIGPLSDRYEAYAALVNGPGCSFRDLKQFSETL